MVIGVIFPAPSPHYFDAATTPVLSGESTNSSEIEPSSSTADHALQLNEFWRIWMFAAPASADHATKHKQLPLLPSAARPMARRRTIDESGDAEEARMSLQFRRTAAVKVGAVVASLACWIVLADLAVAEEMGAGASLPSDSKLSRPPDRPIDPTVLLEPPSSRATKKKVDEEVRELLRQTDELDEESDEDLHGDAPSPPPPELSR
jgi:hypothetical protein